MKLRACDLIPGRLYWSLLGFKCRYMEPQRNGISNTQYIFAYLTSTGRPSLDDGFALSVNNTHTIGALREVQS